MPVTDRESPELGQDAVLDRIYQIALEPSALDEFIDLWCDTSLSGQFIADGADGAAGGDPAARRGVYLKHLERAKVILERGGAARPDPADHLKPYGNLAAFVVGRSLTVAAANRAARQAFGSRERQPLERMGLPEEVRDALRQAVRTVLDASGPGERLVKVDAMDKGGTMLFRVVRLEEALEDGPAALVVSTAFHVRGTVGALLGSVFRLTEAEQDVVRLLVGGSDLRSVAEERGTSEGTTRGQVKSIIAKMNLRSQTDIVRFVMALGEFPKGASSDEEPLSLQVPALSQTWLDTEVWKPFEALELPDGRSMSYHDMGPPGGHPLLMSHMGSCMVRWPRPMIRLAFEHDLRVIVPIRAGYGRSGRLPSGADPLRAASEDAAHLLERLGIGRLPYLAQGTDFPFAADLVSRRPGLVTELIGTGARPCLPGGAQVGGSGRWQRFFVATARSAPHLVEFASVAVMEMSRRIGPEAMLRRLCKDSPSDLALLEAEEMKQVLTANIALMAENASGAAQAFAREYVAFQADLSPSVRGTEGLAVRLFVAEEDPTFDLAEIPRLREAYPWMSFETVPEAGLALTYQMHRRLVPLLARAARDAARGGA